MLALMRRTRSFRDCLVGQYSRSGKVWHFLKKTRHTITTQCSNYPLGHFSQRNENLWSLKNAHSSFIHNSQNPPTPQMSLKRRMVNQSVVPPHHGYCSAVKREKTTDTHNNLDQSPGNDADRTKSKSQKVRSCRRHVYTTLLE